jgi:hypothetical protein
MTDAGTIETAIASRKRKLEPYLYRAPETLSLNDQRYAQIKGAELAVLELALSQWCDDCGAPHDSDYGYGPAILALAEAINFGSAPSDAGANS